MMKILLAVFALALIISIPTAFAQTATSATSATGTSETETELEPFVFENQPYTKPTNLTSEGVGFYEVRNPDGTFTLTSHYPYFETESGEFLPYRINEDSSIIQVEVNGGKIVFDKESGAMTLFNDEGIIVDSDSYVVRSALSGSDVWNNLPLNDSPLTFEVIEQGETLIIEISREDETGLFKMQHIVFGGKLKTTAFFTNYSLENTKIAFTETLNLPDNIITLNDQVIDLNQFVGMSFDRTTLEQNEDLVIQVKERFFNTGIGFDNLWQVNIHENNTVSLDYANTAHVMQIGETIGLDPTWNITGTINGSNVDFNISTLNNASVNSGDIDGTALTSTQITSLQNALNNGDSTWSQPYTQGAIWDTSNLTYSVASGYNTSSNPIRINTSSSSGGELVGVNSGNNGSIILSADQNRNGGSNGGTYLKDMTTNENWRIQYPRSADVHTGSTGGSTNWSLAYASHCSWNDPHKLVISGTTVTAYCGNTVARSGGVANSSNFQPAVYTWGSNDGYNYWDITVTGDFATSAPTLNVNYTLFPSIPTDVSATQNTTTDYNTVDLTWNEGTTGSQSTSYEVFRAGSSIGTVTAPSGLGSSADGTGYNKSNVTGHDGNNAWSFNNASTYVDLGQNFNFDRTDPFSITWWMKSTHNSFDAIMANSDSSNKGWMLVNNNTSRDIEFRLSNTWGSNYLISGFNNASLYDNNWHMVTMVYDGSSDANNTVWYMDGTQQTNINIQNSLTGSTTNSHDTWIGKRGSAPEWYNGSLDDVAFYNKELTSSEVTSIYSGTYPASGLLAHYNFEDTGNTLSNQSTNIPTFTDSNAPDSSNLSYTVTGTNTVGTSAQSSAGLVETFYTPNQVVNVTNQGANSPLVLDWDVPTVPSVTNTATTTASNSLGSSADGTNNGATTGVTGKYGNAWSFDGVNDHVSIPDQSALRINGELTLAMWINPDGDYSHYNTIIAKRDNTDAYYQMFFPLATTSTGLHFYDKYPTSRWSPPSTTSFTNPSSGNWHLVVATVDSSNVLKLYEDNNMIYTTTLSPARNASNTSPVTIGDRFASGSEPFEGDIDDLSIWNRALTSSEINDIYTGTSPIGLTNNSGLLAYYDFEDTGNTLTNISSVSNTTTTASPSVSGYSIERDDGSGFNVIQANHGTNQYSDSTATGSVVYKISGINAVGTGTASADHNAMAGVPPNAPIISTAINDPNSAPLDITVSISPDSVVGTGTLTGFELYRDGALITTTGLVSTYVDTVPNEGNFEYSSKSISTHGTSVLSNLSNITTPSVPDAPATVNTSINNPNSNPFDITIGFSASPNDQGSAITAYKVYRSSDDVTYSLITTLGNSVLSYADTVTGSGGYYYKISSVNNVGEGLQSAYSLINTPTIPNAPVLSSNAINSTQIDSTWSTPSNGNSEILSYEISVDGTVTNVGLVNTNSQTGLTQNTSYEIKIRAVNNVGTSAWSNIQTITTHTPPSGTNTISLNNSWGDVVIVDNTITMSGNPTPTLDKIEFVLDGNIVGTINNPSLTGTYALTLPDTNQHGLLVAATMNNSETTAINSNSLLVTGVTVNRIGAAEGTGTVAYTINRTEHPTNSALDEIELKWARDSFPFNGSCTFMSPSQAMNVRDLNDLPSNLVYHTQSSVNVFDTTVDISEKNNAYIYCWSDTDLMFGAQSEALGSNALLSGLSGLDSALGTTTVDPNTGEETSYSILGAPMIVIFVLLIAGQATGRTAPTFIIILLAAVGILMGLGFFIIDEGIFGLMLIMGALGVMIGKKFL